MKVFLGVMELIYLDCGAVIQIYNSDIFRIVYTNTKEKKE